MLCTRVVHGFFNLALRYAYMTKWSALEYSEDAEVASCDLGAPIDNDNDNNAILTHAAVTRK